MADTNESKKQAGQTPVSAGIYVPTFFKQTVRVFDADKSGGLDEKETKDFIQHLQGLAGLSDDDVKKLNEQVDRMVSDGSQITPDKLSFLISDISITKENFINVIERTNPSETERADRSATFDEMDANKDGIVTGQELLDWHLVGEVAFELANGDKAQRIAANYFAKVGLDTDKDGSISASEFGGKFGTEQAARDAFGTLDKDDNGQVTADELNTFIEGNITSIKLNDSMRKFMQSAMSDGVLDKEERMALSLAMSGVSFQDIQKSGITGGTHVAEAVGAAITANAKSKDIGQTL